MRKSPVTVFVAVGLTELLSSSVNFGPETTYDWSDALNTKSPSDIVDKLDRSRWMTTACTHDEWYDGMNLIV
jgi:hypothetical protein